MSYQPVALFAVEVSPGEIIPVHDGDLPAHIQITMAAIDPTAEPQNKDGPKLSTLRLIRHAMDAPGMGDSDSEDEDEDDELSSDDEEEEKSSKGKKSAKAGKKDEMDVDSEEEEEDEDDDEEDGSVDRYVLCTLDTEKNYQQPLNITVQEGEVVFFQVTGNYPVYVTGNYVVPDEHREDEDSDEDSEDEDYDLSPSEDELYGDSDESEDDLDDVSDPRITEVTSEDEKEEKKKDTKANNKKRAAEETDDKKEEPKLNKKQLKKLKANDGKAAEAPAKPETPSKTEGKGDTPSKKVKFAKELEQGPTPSKNDPSSKKDDKKEKKAEKKESQPPAIRKIGNMTVEDKKLGQGAVAKKGNKVKVRYIGKLTNGKQFDACTKGKPFQFTLGKGEVIKGWDLGIAGMAPGGERRLTVPPEMGYGNKAAGSIPKNSTLIFDVKCIGIN
ncbi:hypothetical protein BJ508DRAFT_415972 [Ascobolus immersus RN42]|uniref:FK506-binding protein n=1 Tax=Ascobolus immersus RN42 TaxID=1160509 RepID=A0A3N4HZQ9_ASCIM|nr:hypothetical protein BJ508DRAFT_415972 [Ascobolus immersus RN42]